MPGDLDQFVREALTRGVPRERIRAALAAAHWRAEEIEAALASWAESDLPIPVPRRRISTSAGEAFLYLLMFATLYVSTFDAGAAWFALVDRWWPDRTALGSEFVFDASLTILRWSAAGMLIAFPVFLIAARAVGRVLAREPEKRASGVRRWLTYLTLFVAAMVLVGDLVVLVSSLLGGALTRAFLLKSAVVFAIAGAVFGHYLPGLRRDESGSVSRPPRSRWIGPAGAAGTLVTLVLALAAAGSPERARLRQQDQARVRDLQRLSNAVINYRAVHTHLPVRLEDLRGAAAQFEAVDLADPVTRTPYAYTVIDSTTFTLCAMFAAADSLGPWGARADPFWRHPAGRACFTFHR